MIEAIIFDLDGTLVRTENLKAISYARAAVRLRPDDLVEEEVVEAFKDVVGYSRREVAQSLLERFDLEAAARKRMAEFEVSVPWQVYVQIRLRIYESMLEDAGILRKYRCPYNIGLLRWAQGKRFKIGLATMSHCQQAQRILKILDIQNEFDFIATQDDVEKGKPDPEIYYLSARELAVNPAECLVIEDSTSGLQAALAAGMCCIAVTTDITRKSVHKSNQLEDRWIVDDPTNLKTVVQTFIDQHK